MRQSWIGADASIVVLTGAGISAESGLPVFRGEAGLWNGRRPEDLATPEAFARVPDVVHEFYNERRRQLQSTDVQPNAAHLALAELARRWLGRVSVITQNVDDLHERAGQEQVIHMHGRLDQVRCLKCMWSGRWEVDLGVCHACPRCEKTGCLRPDIVWFGETPAAMDKIEEALEICDLFVAIGTSGNVYPAAGFVEAVRANALTHTVEINLQSSAMASKFSERRYGRASVEVPRFVKELLTIHA